MQSSVSTKSFIVIESLLPSKSLATYKALKFVRVKSRCIKAFLSSVNSIGACSLDKFIVFRTSSVCNYLL